MPDLIAITKRTQEIVLERFMRWRDDLKQQAQKAKDAPQREKRAAYEAMRATMGQSTMRHGRHTMTSTGRKSSGGRWA